MNQKLSVNSSVSVLKGVGPKMLQTLEAKSIIQLQDILFYLPLRYEDRTRLTPMSQLFSGKKMLLDGEVVSSQIQFGRKRSFLAKVCVEGVMIGLRFYFFNKAQQQQFKAGRRVRVFGALYKGASGSEMYHPEYTLYNAHEQSALPIDETLTPVYPAIDGIGQKVWRKLLTQCFDLLGEFSVDDYLQGIKNKKLEQGGDKRSEQSAGKEHSLKNNLLTLHFPPKGTDLASLENGSHPSMQFLIVEELLAHYLSRKIQHEKNKNLNAPSAPYHDKQKQLLDQLPFKLTGAQQRVCKEISKNLNSKDPMLRLLQGDVGSGKTLVAVWSAVQMVMAGYQVAMMAPTEILSQQHMHNVSQWFDKIKIKVAWLASSVSASKRKALLKNLASGEIDVLIGTHAIFQKDVIYARLGFVIIDEQHRFGVHQRLALRDKAPEGKPWVPHQLIMTATPIPRTLAMSLYAGVDVSTIDELPKGRQAIDTVLMDEKRRSQLFERIAKACDQGKQIYWVCTLIENSEIMDSQAVEDAHQELSSALPHLKIEQLHGKMKAAEKQNIMQRFSQGEIHVLVATTVIEVGVDVPNASIIVIENSERLGLSQLHQLRGRVGRGSEKSYCVMLYTSGLSAHARARLQTIRQHQDGFIIAEEDLRLRGAGELFGVRQSGDLSMRVADLHRDSYLLEEVKSIAEQIQHKYPQRIEKIIQRWLPNAQEYVYV